MSQCENNTPVYKLEDDSWSVKVAKLFLHRVQTKTISQQERKRFTQSHKLSKTASSLLTLSLWNDPDFSGQYFWLKANIAIAYHQHTVHIALRCQWYPR